MNLILFNERSVFIQEMIIGKAAALIEEHIRD